MAGKQWIKLLDIILARGVVDDLIRCNVIRGIYRAYRFSKCILGCSFPQISVNISRIVTISYKNNFVDITLWRMVGLVTLKRLNFVTFSKVV